MIVCKIYTSKSRVLCKRGGGGGGGGGGEEGGEIPSNLSFSPLKEYFVRTIVSIIIIWLNDRRPTTK